jgi:hypothetical protein
MSNEHRDRIGHGLKRFHERKRKLARVLPGDLREVSASGTVRPELKFVVKEAGEEASQVLEALGSSPSPQQRLLVADLARLGAVLRLELMRAMQMADSGESVARVGSLVGHRRSILALLGLQRRERELDLRTYLAQRASEREAPQDHAGATNGDQEQAEGLLDGRSAS